MIGLLIIFINCLYLVYFGTGLIYHGYFVLVPKRLRCGKAEKTIAVLHAKIPINVSKAVYPNHHHKLIDHHGDSKNAEAEAKRLQTELVENEAFTAKQLALEKSAAKQKLEERKRKKAQKKAARKAGQEAAVVNAEGKTVDDIVVEIEMVEGKSRKK